MSSANRITTNSSSASSHSSSGSANSRRPRSALARTVAPRPPRDTLRQPPMHANGAQGSVAILSAGWDRPYAFGLTNALLATGLSVELIAGDDLSAADFAPGAKLKVLNFRVTSS